ncbi:Helix-turn-helix domain-containing protein [Chitinophaga rupis]|uniref:Helix-turn-helix domain-containing protein n=1 Tax=Chitinophaga rupis TaxID=573321 RepID=A0A1H7LXV7_9BACT|nr:helix-turn-helix domain-containing protein [Chitinophaga rupis]SEL03764.1 Helix-turn-helix domain-containing protein [Chitinophaga rupis]
MALSEDIGDFYKRNPSANAGNLSLHNANPGHFNVFFQDNTGRPLHRRRDYYKISFIKGIGKVHFADKWIEVDQPVLIVSNPQVAYSWEGASENRFGWFCVFTESFLQPADRIGFLHESPLFTVGHMPVYFPNQEQQQEITLLFQKMVREIALDYEHKYTILRNCLHLLLYEALKMSPAAGFHKQINASSRIAHLFFDLLERQFPVDNRTTSLQLKSPQDYAVALSIHVNHLNRAVKEATGKTTSHHIAARIIQEANLLLQHTDWSISEIAYSLGFEYPAYFTRFFRKNTGHAPVALRQHSA